LVDQLSQGVLLHVWVRIVGVGMSVITQDKLNKLPQRQSRPVQGALAATLAAVRHEISSNASDVHVGHKQKK
jgi:hypothetical protein